MKYYLTTPIYYTNGAPHIGHAYATMACDTVRRFKRLQGYEVVLTTGTDEHGVNVERSAKAAGKNPKEFVDTIVKEWRRHWDELKIQGDEFIRTSSPAHHRTVQWLFERCRNSGYVYKGTYTGQYCIYDNLYVNDAKPGDNCPECGRPTETVTEENYYFKLSVFQQKLLDLYEREPKFIQPESRRNEVLRFVQSGLNDLSITRTSVQWGIPVPGEAPHVFYVWFDALIAYLTGAGGPEYEERGLWPADLHMIGKEIVRFHAVFWPAFLMAADLPLPKRIFAHGWLLVEQDKMSKSRGNVVRPLPIAQVMGADALRYFLLREVVFGQDGSFSYDALVQRYNSDLANGLGNLASRTLSMIHQYRAGLIPASQGDQQIARNCNAATEAALDAYEEFEFNRALEAIWSLISDIDKFIVERAPWKLARQNDVESQKLLDNTLYTAAETLRIVCGLLSPVLPEAAAKIRLQLGFTTPIESVRTSELDWGHLPEGQKLGKVDAVFPRADAKLSIEKMQQLEEQELARQNALLGKAQPAALHSKAQPAAEPAPAATGDGKITIDDFAKVDLRVGLVKSAEPVKGADKLLHMSIDIGEPEPR
ncbi:MAG TPA: methionine--tRNA ligase, partial [Bryobacteraceae bacterium]|nr:methionine--tRNA ligase [Bryobacteraceae bacterium]